MIERKLIFKLNKTKKNKNKSKKNKSKKGGSLARSLHETNFTSFPENTRENNSVNSQATEIGDTCAFVVEEDSRKLGTINYSTVNLEIQQLTLPIHQRPGTGPIRKINFYKGERCIGYATFIFENRTFEIVTIFLNDCERSFGYGKRILYFLMRYAFEQLNASEIELEDATDSPLFNPCRHPNNMYKKAKFLPILSNVYLKRMRLRQERYRRLNRLISRYLNS
jgi:RimJ/RimL family protein N-acetyltransferase